MSIHVVPVKDTRQHSPSSDCWCHPLKQPANPGGFFFVHNAQDARERFERQNGKKFKHGWEVWRHDDSFENR